MLYLVRQFATDPNGAVKVKLTLKPQKLSSIQGEIRSAEAMISQKVVLLDTLGDARGIAEFIINSVNAISDVSDCVMTRTAKLIRLDL